MVLASHWRRLFLAATLFSACGWWLSDAPAVAQSGGDSRPYLSIDDVVPLGTRRHDRVDSLYLDLAAQPQFASVGRFLIPTGGGGAILGSGTLIRSDWVLTAAHVVSNNSGVAFNPSNVRFTLGGTDYFGAEVILHPNYVNFGASVLDGWDIALVRLQTAVTGVASAKINTTFGNEIGRVGTYVGFGSTGTGLTGNTQAGGIKRAGDNVIDTDGTFFSNISDKVLLTDFDSPTSNLSTFGSSAPLNLEYMIAPGDSGGAQFIETDDGWLLAGVNSFVSQGRGGSSVSSYGWLGGTMRVSSHADWIVQTVPEPSSWLLMLSVGVTVVTVVLVRRRSASARLIAAVLPAE
jgi:secreted trypsin-like serine protease